MFEEQNTDQRTITLIFQSEQRRAHNRLETPQHIRHYLDESTRSQLVKDIAANDPFIYVDEDVLQMSPWILAFCICTRRKATLA